MEEFVENIEKIKCISHRPVNDVIDRPGGQKAGTGSRRPSLGDSPDQQAEGGSMLPPSAQDNYPSD